MLNINIYTPELLPSEEVKVKVVDFLFDQLEEYGDPKEDIRKAMNYSLGYDSKPGGYVIVGEVEGEIIGVVILNITGMEDYIPENILVYIATHRDARGKGYGKRLMKAAIDQTKGAIALHVEPNNPAKSLYEKLGFTNKYLEMRLKK